MFEIDNSERILNNIICHIHNQFEKKFSQEDSIYIFNLSKWCKIERFGYAKIIQNEQIIAKVANLNLVKMTSYDFGRI